MTCLPTLPVTLLPLTLLLALGVGPARVDAQGHMGHGAMTTTTTSPSMDNAGMGMPHGASHTMTNGSSPMATNGTNHAMKNGTSHMMSGANSTGSMNHGGAMSGGTANHGGGGHGTMSTGDMSGGHGSSHNMPTDGDGTVTTGGGHGGGHGSGGGSAVSGHYRKPQPQDLQLAHDKYTKLVEKIHHMGFFHVSFNTVILFEQWITSTWQGLLASCIGVTVISTLYEAIKLLRGSLMAKARKSRSEKFTKVPSIPQRMFSGHHLLQALLHVFQTVYSYMLMLIFMTFNVWLCVSVAVGFGLGYLLFRWNENSSDDSNDHCM